MGALPKRKISKGRKGRRRAHNALVMPAFGPCPKCSKPKKAHFECEFCGHYGSFTKKATAKATAKKTADKKESK